MTDVNETILNPETPGAVNPVPVGAADAAEGTAANPAPAAGGTAAMVAAMRQDHAATGSGGDAAAVADAAGGETATTAAGEGIKDGAAAGEPHAPGLVQVGRMGRRVADDAAARAEKLREVKARGESSELRAAKAAVAAAGTVSLTPAEERDLRDYAEGEDDLRELREEKLEEKREQAALRQARSRVNAEVPSRTLVQRPTYGATRGKVELHVRDTYAFLLGREADPERHKGYISGMWWCPKMYADKRRANKKQRRHGIFEVWKLKIPFAVPVAVDRI